MSAESPKISVVIPVYNGEKFIERSVESVLRQEYPAHEILVVNDGSSDGTEKILERYRGRLRVMTIPNGGVAQARNTGILAATGDYVVLLDADDFWFKRRLLANAEFIRRFPEVGFFVCNFITRYLHYGNRLVRHYSTLSNRRRLNFDEPLRGNAYGLLLESYFAGTPSSYLFKRTLGGETPLFDPKRKLVEDMEFLHRISMRTSFLLIQEVLFFKTSPHSQSMSLDQLKLYQAHRDVLLECCNKHQEYLRTHHLEKKMDKALSWMSYMIGNLYFEAGDKEHAFATYTEAWKYQRSPGNFFRYLWAVLKKSIRLLIQ